VSQGARDNAAPPLSRGDASHPAEFAKENHHRRQLEEHSPDIAAPGARRIKELAMNVICLTSQIFAMSYPPCHVERSETSLDVTRHAAAANDLRLKAWPRGLRSLRCSFASLS